MNDRTQEEPPLRLGPRPLALHLATAMTAWSSSLAALPSSRSGLQPWSAAVAREAEALRGELESAPADELAAAVGRAAGERFDRLTAAILRYRTAPPRRVPEPVPTVWVEGSARLLDYGQLARAPGLPVFVVPSLVNRAHVLDLLPERSFLRSLAAAGLRPLLLDWDAPGPEERTFGLDAYVARLERAFDAAAEIVRQRPAVIGYCMGGVLATALASRRADLPALALLATPWDFHAGLPEQARLTAASLGPLEPLLQALGELPVDALQTLFWMLDPLQGVRKFLAFGKMDAGSPAAELFVALEDWVNDGVPLTAPVARECFRSWYGENEPARGRWKVGGEPVDPARIGCSTLVVAPHRDRIVPPASATALAAALPGAEVLRPAAGHIGMVAGGRAEREVVAPLAEWLLAHPAP